jgi:Flp pilus assembly protein TadB
MTALLLAAFAGLVAGGFMMLSLSPFELAGNVAKLFQRRKKTLAQKIKEATNAKKIKGIRKTVMETKEILEVTGKQNLFGTLTVFSILLFIAGAFLSLLMGNALMIPVMAAGFSLLPFWYVMFTANFYKKQLNAELETALSIITTSYLRSENFILAVEENISYLNPPVCDVFKSFLARTNLINADLRLALESIKYKVASEVYREWIDAVIACQEDKTLKTTLTPIISKLSDMRVVSAELDILLYEPMKEFITMALLLVGNIPLIYFLNKSWFDTLMNTLVGKGILALSAGALFVSLAAVIRLTRPIEYKR